MAGTLDLYGNEADFFLVLLCSYLTSTIITTCCLNTCPSQVHTVQSLSVILPQPSNNLNSDVFLNSLDDWQSPPDSNCRRKFATKPSGGIPFTEDVTLDEHGNANMSWHCAGVRVSSPRSMLNLKSYIVFSVDLLSRADILNCQTNQCQFIYLEEVLGFMEQHSGMVDIIFVYFILRTTGTCMMG